MINEWMWMRRVCCLVCGMREWEWERRSVYRRKIQVEVYVQSITFMSFIYKWAQSTFFIRKDWKGGSFWSFFRVFFSVEEGFYTDEVLVFEALENFVFSLISKWLIMHSWWCRFFLWLLCCIISTFTNMFNWSVVKKM